MTGRATEEWRGSSPDAAIPARVKLRIWERCEGRCGLSGRKLRPGDAYDFDHIKPLADEGEHRELNLHVVSREKHRLKTADEAAERAITRRTKAKHIGIKGKSRLTHSTLKRRFDGTVVPR